MLREPGGQHVLWEATRHPRQPFGPSVSDKKMMLFFFFLIEGNQLHKFLKNAGFCLPELKKWSFLWR